MSDQPEYVYYGSGLSALDRASRDAEKEGRIVYALIGETETKCLRVMCQPDRLIVVEGGSIKLERTK